MCASMCVFGEFTRKLTRFQVVRLVNLGVVHILSTDTTAGAVITATASLLALFDATKMRVGCRPGLRKVSRCFRASAVVYTVM